MNSSRLSVAMGCVAVIAGCAILGLDGGLEVAITLDVPEVSPSAPARMSVTARNTSSSRITWGQGSGGCQLTVAAQINGTWVSIDNQRGCTKDLTEQGLDPGKARTEVFSWDGHVVRAGQTEQLPPGTYPVRGEAGDKGESPSVLVTIHGAT